MDRIFRYSANRRDRNTVAFRVVAGTHADLLRAIGSNSVTGYVVDKGSFVMVPQHAADAISRHLVALGWSLGV